MNNLKELEKKYEELGKEIERLKKEQESVGFKNDPIFLLSAGEYKKYKTKIPEIHCKWWLRSSGYCSTDPAIISTDGSIGLYGDDVIDDCYGIRPALRISAFVSTKLHKFIPIINANQPQSYHKFGDKIVFNGVTWVKIDEDLYISELPIDFRIFDKKSNNYETSEVRKFLLHWYEDRLELN